MWKVGNGNRINIWEDSWLNDEQRRKIITLKPNNCTYQRVKELLNQDGVGWNMHILSQLFSAAEIQAIRRTPISTMGLSDRLVWTSSNNGQYTVKSGYKVAKSYERKLKEDEGGATGIMRNRAIYGKEYGAWRSKGKCSSSFGKRAITDYQ